MNGKRKGQPGRWSKNWKIEVQLVSKLLPCPKIVLKWKKSVPLPTVGSSHRLEVHGRIFGQFHSTYVMSGIFSTYGTSFFRIKNSCTATSSYFVFFHSSFYEVKILCSWFYLWTEIFTKCETSYSFSVCVTLVWNLTTTQSLLFAFNVRTQDVVVRSYHTKSFSQVNKYNDLQYFMFEK